MRHLAHTHWTRLSWPKRLFVMAVWTVAAVLMAGIWISPSLADLMQREQFPLGVITGLMLADLLRRK